LAETTGSRAPLIGASAGAAGGRAAHHKAGAGHCLPRRHTRAAAAASTMETGAALRTIDNEREADAQGAGAGRQPARRRCRAGQKRQENWLFPGSFNSSILLILIGFG